MAKIKITIQEGDEKPITGLEFADFENMPEEWIDMKEIEPGIYMPVTKEKE